jgi:alanyl aminopeptidase
MRIRAVVLSVLFACGKQPAPVVPATPPASPPTPVKPVAAEPAYEPEAPKLRLPQTVAPTHYAVELHLDPNQKTFAGTVDIDVDVREATRVIWLHGKELTIQTAKLGDTRLEARPATNEFLPLVASAPLPAGKARLHIDYQGKISDVETDGIFRQKSGDDWYAFTQFEATDARRAFPCFDEPSFKVPWQLTIHAPKGDIAVSNTQVAGQTPGEAGGTVFRFNETKPLPSYLVAFAVGPIEAVDAGRTRSGVPLRILVPRGRGEEAAYAAKVTVEIVNTLEDYFGIPFPYEKLDSIFIPRTVGFGAMENPGLITYSEGTIITKPSEDSLRRQRRYAMIAAHEIAHHWFGDLVTLAWWNDVWLNEAFASWAENKVMELWKPEWDQGAERVNDRSNALAADSQLSARQIRQPIESINDIANAFDGITYQKGAAVISMFELWAGKDKFQKGVHRYLSRHAWKNATSEDFLTALGEDVGPELPVAFKTFLEQPGAPVVRAELKCDGAAKLLLKQSRYLPPGGQAKPQMWQIPVCARTNAGRACTLLKEETGELPLAASCKGLTVFPNAESAGYYVTDLAGDLRTKIFANPKALPLNEDLGLLADVTMLVDNGSLPAGEALALLSKIDPARNRHLTRAALGGFRQAGLLQTIRLDAVPDAMRPQWAKYIQKLFGAQARKLGIAPKAGEDDDVRLLRPLLIGIVGDDGRDKEIIAESKKLALRWLEDKKAISPEMQTTVLNIAAHHGDAAFYDKLLALAKQSKQAKERGEYLEALGMFRDPELQKRNREIVLSDAFDIREVGTLAFGGINDDTSREAMWTWFKANYDAYVGKLPEPSRGFVIRIGGGFCDEAHQKEVQDFFGERIKAIRGGPRTLKSVTERIGSCARLRAAQQPSVLAFLKKL